MFEREKRHYPVYRIDRETREAHALCLARAYIYFTTDRRDEDKDHLCVFLKKTYRALFDPCDIAEGDIVSYGGEKLRVISVDKSGEEFSVHLESVQIIDTGAFVLKGDNNV
jgi:hypothetical protein